LNHWLNSYTVISELKSKQYQNQVINGFLVFLEYQFGSLEKAINTLLTAHPDIINTVLVFNEDVMAKLTPAVVAQLKYTPQEIVDWQDEQHISNLAVRSVKHMCPSLWPTEEACTLEKKAQNNAALSVFTSQCIVDDQTITYSETDIVQKIDAVISVLKKKNLLTNQNPLFSEKKLRIKISSDGFQHSMKNENVSFSFVVLNTEEVHSTLASWDVLVAECWK